MSDPVDYLVARAIRAVNERERYLKRARELGGTLVNANGIGLPEIVDAMQHAAVQDGIREGLVEALGVLNPNWAQHPDWQALLRSSR